MGGIIMVDLQSAAVDLCGKLRFLSWLEENANSDYAINLSFKKIADIIGVSYSTLKNYLHNFCKSNYLKFDYKTSTIVLNPKFFKTK
jgi:DNA-binding IclR family transcriptional regulator